MDIVANYQDSFTRKTSLVVAGFGLLFWALIAISYITPNPVAETLEVMAWLGLFCVLGVIVILGVMSYGLRLWLVPTVLCVVFILSIRLVAPVTNALDDWWLKSHLSEFNQLVTDIKNGTVQTTQRLAIVEITKIRVLPKRVVQVSAVRCGHGTAVVELTLSNAGRVATGYLFDDCGDPKISIVNSPIKQAGIYVHPILGRWYKFTE